MPTYAYVCRACEHAFEIQQTFSEKPLTSCPKCSGELRKQFGTLGVSFKGSGFYRTDSQSAKSDSTSSSSSSD